MKSLIALSIVLVASLSQASETAYYSKSGNSLQPLSKPQALLTLLTNKDATVLACKEQKVSDKATLKAKD